MPKGKTEKPVITSPTSETLEAFRDRPVKVIDKDETVHVGRLVLVNEGAIILHRMTEAGKVPHYVMRSEIESIQEVPRSALTSASTS